MPSRRLMRRPSREAQRSCLSLFLGCVCAWRVASWCAGMKPHHAHTLNCNNTHTQSHTHTQTDTFLTCPFSFIDVHKSTQKLASLPAFILYPCLVFPLGKPWLLLYTELASILFFGFFLGEPRLLAITHSRDAHAYAHA